MDDRRVQQTVIGSVGVLAIAGAYLSWSHTYSFARAAGQSAADAGAYPVTSDVLVLAAIVCVLHAARTGRTAAFARWAFGLGVAATVAANAGDRFRPLPFIVGVAVSAWPGVAVVAGLVLAHWLIDGGRGAAEIPQQQLVTGTSPAIPEPERAAVPAIPAVPSAEHGGVPGVPEHEHVPAAGHEHEHEHSGNGHNPDVRRVLDGLGTASTPTIRQVKDVLHCGTDRARQAQQAVAAVSAGP